MTESHKPRPAVGRIVHYVSYGTPGGEFKSVCRAAVITELQGDDIIGLCVLNPTGLFFHDSAYSEAHKGGTWHWPELIK